MVKLAKIQSSLFPNLYRSFLIDDDPYSKEQDWRRVFDYQWEHEQDHCGYALLDGDEVVGMVGMVFSERCIDGTIKKFCNLHTWWVREDHRGRSLLLLRPVLGLKGYTITHFTPCDRIRAITKRMGFKKLSKQLRILLPFPGAANTGPGHASNFTYDEHVIAQKLTGAHHRVFSDHRPYGVGHLVIDDGDDYCYLLYTHVVRHWMPYCHVHYISNKAIFERHEPVIRSSLLRKHTARFVAVDARLVSDVAFRFSFKFWAPAPALYKSSDAEPGQIDNLYSDIVMLKLTVLPGMRNVLAGLAGKLSPPRLLRPG